MEGFNDKQMEQLKDLFVEERVVTKKMVQEIVDVAIEKEHQTTRQHIDSVRDELKEEIGDANQQRKEDDDIILEKIGLVEARVDKLELTKA